jgi:hypothetical protein
MDTVGITALVPPELIFACDKIPCDVNNFVPLSQLQPSAKLCAWTAIWREMILKAQLPIDSLVVVAGGDCHNAIVDGEKIEMSGVPSLYFFYPFEKDVDYLSDQLKRLSDFLGGIKDPNAFEKIGSLKQKILDLDKQRVDGRVPSDLAFKIMVSCSDFKGDLDQFERTLTNVKEENVDYTNRIALLGVPPINFDFHKLLKSYDFHVVYDELPYEFARLTGNNLEELARSYVDYTFARNIEFRLDFLKTELS